MSYPAISLATATVSRHRRPQKRLQTARQPPVYPSSSPDYRACTPSPPFRCPHAVHPCPSVDSGLAENGYLCGGYPIDLNDTPINVNICNIPTLLYPPPPADDSRRLFSSITVTPVTASPAPPAPPDPLPQPFTFTITVTNRDDEPEGLNKIHAMLPPGFEFVDSSTGGVTNSNPAIQGQKLTWNLAPLHITLQPAAPGVPAEYRQLSFVAEAILGGGNYCTEAWADPGQIKTGTGLDALIQVGVPTDNLCTGYAVSLDMTSDVAGGTVVGSNPITVDYTIIFQNKGTLPLISGQSRLIIFLKCV